MGKKKYNVKLTDEEVKELKGKIRDKKTSKMILRRCQILLDIDENHGKVISRSQCVKANVVCQAYSREYTNRNMETGGMDNLNTHVKGSLYKNTHPK